MAKRKNGYYWVKVHYTHRWEIARYSNGYWFLTGYGTNYTEELFSEIGERIERKHKLSKDCWCNPKVIKPKKRKAENG